jgi:hypothetical protein
LAEQENSDIATILESLRAEVRAQRAAQGAGEAGTAPSAVERELHHAAEQLEITRVVSAHWPLEGKTPYERGWALINKVVRRALRWYIHPIVEQQNAFNDAATRSLRLLIEAHAELRDQMADLRRDLDRPPPPRFPAPPILPSSEPPPTAELQQLVERAGRAEPPAPLPDLGMREIARQLDARRAVSAHWEIRGDTPLTRARALGQRTIRQYLRWLINPIVEQQNAFNDALASAAPPLVAIDGELRARVAALRVGAARGASQ